MERAYQTLLEELEEDYDRRIEEWEQEKPWRNSVKRPRRRRIPSELEHDEHGQWNLQATIAFPYWDRQTKKLEPGTFCRACTFHWEEAKADDWRRMETIFHPHPPSREAYYRAFLESDLPAHFQHCAAVKANYNFREAKAERRREGTDFVVKPTKVTG